MSEFAEGSICTDEMGATVWVQSNCDQPLRGHVESVR